jgi:hypothetical protein
MKGDNDDILPNALSAMSIDDGPSRRAGIAGVNGGGSSDSLAGVVHGERYVGQQQQQSYDDHQDPRISPPSHHHQQSNIRSSEAAVAPPQNNAISAAAIQQPQITIDDIPPEMREAFIQLDPDQQALALEMLAQQKLEQQQQLMEEEFARPEEHFLTIALNGKRRVGCALFDMFVSIIIVSCLFLNPLPPPLSLFL